MHTGMLGKDRYCGLYLLAQVPRAKHVQLETGNIYRGDGQ